MLPVRLQKFIADSGLMSRRAAEAEIERGYFSVNGHVAEIGMKIDPASDVVAYKGKRIRYEKLTLANPFDHVYKLPVIDGQSDSILVANSLGSEVIRQRENKDICKQVKLVRYAIAPIKRGDILGEIIYTEEGKEISRMPIVATESVDKKKQDGFFSKILSIFD